MSPPHSNASTEAATLKAYVEQALTHPLSKHLFDDRARYLCVVDPDGTVVFVNESGISASGLRPDDIIGQPVWTIPVFHGDDQAETQWRARLSDAASTDAPLAFDEYYELEGVGSRMRTELWAIRSEGGQLLGYFARTTDVDQVRRAQERVRDQAARLQASEVQFRVMTEALPQMAWVVRAPDEYLYLAPKWEAFTGRSPEELLEKGVMDLVHPDDRVVVERDGFRRDRVGDSLVFRMLRHDGEYRWVEARMAAVDDPDGGTRWFGVTLDITDRIEQELELRRHEEQLRATLELTGFGTYVWLVPEDRFSEDSQLEEILGVPMDAMKTGNAYELFFSIVHAEDRAQAQASIAAAMQPGGPNYEAEFRIIRPAGGGHEERWVSAMGTIDFDDRGEPLRLIGVFADITDQRLEEAGRLRLQKMEAIGTLASGIAHDFNNVIGAILSYARVAEAEIRAGASPDASIAEIARGAHRAGDIVKRLLTFSRDVEHRRVAFQLAEVVEEAETLLRPTLPSTVVIRASYPETLPAVIGDPTQLHQVVVNLVTNAGQALGAAGGSIELAITPVKVGARPTGITSGLEPGQYLSLTVADDGPGMSEAVAARIFDPFFTTKTESDGTGLGLAAVQSIIKNHGGSVAVETSPGNGARFTVYVPVASADAPGARQPEPTGPLPESAGGARVLFVDDEQALVRLAYRAMPYHGCVVTGFTDPREALAVFEADPQAFDALVTDYSMPGLTGLELTKSVLAIRPELPVVLTSGYLTAAAQGEAERHGVGAVVSKPCSIDTLASEVMRLLA